MTQPIAVVMPAFHATDHVVSAAKSLLRQSIERWELLIVSDDGIDYEAVLGRQGVADRRIRQLTTGAIGTGASAARNVALEATDADLVAVLDADDQFHPHKLERCLGALEEHPLVSTAICAVDTRGRPLRTIGAGTTRVLAANQYKAVNLSMDSMIAWDRRRCDARYDPTLPNMNDLDFLLRLFARAGSCLHIGTPLHDYVKTTGSLSSSPGFTERMISAKTTIVARLARGDYDLDERGVDGVTRFLAVSIAAERAYPAALGGTPGLLFEDHIEPMLQADPYFAAAASTSEA